MSEQKHAHRRPIGLKRNRLFLAFPGMGKTPLAMAHGIFKDVDFGTFRAGMGYAKENEMKLLPIFRNYLMALDADWRDAIILTNEPKLAYFMKIDKMYLPDRRYFRYNAKKMGVDVFTIEQWVNDWAQIAKRFDIPVVYIKVGLDHYFDY